MRLYGFCDCSVVGLGVFFTERAGSNNRKEEAATGKIVRTKLFKRENLIKDFDTGLLQ